MADQKERIKNGLKKFETMVFSHLTKIQAKVICVCITILFLLLYYFTPSGRFAINIVGYVCFTVGILYLAYQLFQYASNKASKEPKPKKVPEPEDEDASESEDEEVAPEAESESEESPKPVESEESETEETDEPLPFEPDDSDESEMSEEESAILEKLEQVVLDEATKQPKD